MYKLTLFTILKLLYIFLGPEKNTSSQFCTSQLLSILHVSSVISLSLSLSTVTKTYFCFQTWPLSSGSSST